MKTLTNTILVGSIFLLLMSCMNSCALLHEHLKPAVKSESPQPTDTITIETGDLSGVYSSDGKVKVYAGIPYAAPPLGELRWKSPQPAKKWEGVRKADHFSAIAMQTRTPLPLARGVAKALGTVAPEYYEPMDEDCLYLNVWAPARKSVEPYPVLVFIHGGALRSGSGSEDMYNGEEAARNGVIMVTINYRLGVFGYLSLPELSEESGKGSGNYGLLDQIAALEWVQRNIAKFGGDPSKVTVAGESAGSQSVSALCASPLAKDLFRAAIGESATFVAPVLASPLFTQDRAEQNGLKYMADCDATSLAELRAMKAEDLLKHELSEISICVDGYALPELAWDIFAKGGQNDVALLAGYNAEEGTLFTIGQNPSPESYDKSLRDIFGDKADAVKALYPGTSKEEAKRSAEQITGLYSIGWPTWKWAEAQSKSGACPTYLYYYTHVSSSGMQPFHGTEMSYAYFNPDTQTKWDNKDRTFARKMFTYWMNFVKTLNPNGNGLPRWQSYQEAPNLILELGDSNIGMIPDPNQALYDLLDNEY